MGSRFVRPETTKLSISEGDWLLVKTRLTSGEQRAVFSRMYLTDGDGTLRRNPLLMGLGLVTAYLLDWSLTDDEGKPVVIRDVSVEDLIATLDGLAPEDFAEIRTAIEAHEAAQTAEREALKKTTAGTRSSAPISPSPSAVAGASAGSVN